MHKIVEDGVIPTFIELLKTEVPDTVKHCCAALCQLAQDSTSCEKIVDLGAVPHIVAGVVNGDYPTKQSCCSVLSALSFQSRCRENLCSMGALTALISLAEMEDTDTSLRCALAFANLSLEPTVQGSMIKQGVLPILKKLSNSYSEENQMFVAKAFANLSCHVGSEKLMIEQDCVSALMMIGMVRSVHSSTKQVCIKALQNLLTEDSVENLCNEGLVSIISNFSKLDDEPTMRVCANIYNFLSCSSYGREKLIEKTGALHGLLNLLRNVGVQPDRSTQAIVGKTICNLLCHPDSQQSIIEVGAIFKMAQIATLGDNESELNCAHAFFLICGEEVNRRIIVEALAIPTIILLCRSANDETRWNAIRVIANLAQYPDTRESLLSSNAVNCLVKLVDDDATSSSGTRMLEVACRSLCSLAMAHAFFLICGEEVNRRIIVEALAIPTIILLCRSANDETRWNAIRVIANLAQYPDTRESLLSSNAVNCLVKLVDDDATSSSGTRMLEVACRSLCSLAMSEKYAAVMVEEGVVKALVKIQSNLKDGKLNAIISNTLRCMSVGGDDVLEMMLEDGAIELLVSLGGNAGAVEEELEGVSYDGCLMLFGITGNVGLRSSVIERGGLEILGGVEKFTSCHDLTVATLFLLSLKSDDRKALATAATGGLLVNLAMLDSNSTPMTKNVSQALFMLSKSEKSRDALLERGLPAALVKLTKSEDR